MRTFVLIGGVFTLLVGLFIGYTFWQTGTVRVEERRPAPSAPVGGRNDGSKSLVGATERPWVTRYDAQWRPTSQFRAAEFEPQEGDRVFVREAEARFFLGGGEMIRVRGKEGVVVMARLPEAGQDPRALGPAEPPTRGELKTVEIELFESQEALHADTPDSNTAILRVTLDNAAFDNETFRIYTDDTVIDGQPVPAHAVPVIMTGRDYDFEGEGLTIRWNERDRRLEMLRVHKGHRLVVKNPDALNRGVLRQRREERALRPLPLMLAATDPAAVADAISTRPAHQDQPYRATFSRNLRIMRGDAELIRGDEMFIDFQLSNRREGPADAMQEAPTEQVPTEQTADASSAPRQPGTTRPTPATAPAIRQAATGTVAAAPQEAPEAETVTPSSTQPVPLTIYWDGELLVQPLPEHAPTPAPDTASVHMTGSPLRITEKGSEITCATLLYDSESETLSLDRNDVFPLVMRGENGARIDGTNVTYVLPSRLAVFRGKASALLPVKEDDADAPRALTAEWTEQCTLQLAGGDLSDMTIETADMEGNVRVEHPSLRLNAERLQLAMEPAEGSDGADMLLRELTATGDVDCVISDDPANPRSIVGQKVQVKTALNEQSKLYPREISAAGRVVAKDAGQTFTAEHLVAKLLPAAAEAEKQDKAEGRRSASPEVGLEHLVAMGGAEYTTAEGRVAAADQIEVAARDGGHVITLLGAAKVSDGTSTLHGPHIQAFTQDQLVKVLGAGSLDAVREVREGETPRPITAEWSRGVVVDGKANRVDVTGDVVVTTSEADGTAHAIMAERLAMHLADAAREEAADGDREEKKQDPGRELMGDKVVREIAFENKVEVRSLRTAADGSLLRRLNLEGQKLNYDVMARRMTVPGAGRLLFQDHPPTPDAQQAADGQPKKVAMNGDTAMKWNDQLVYDETAQQITLEGDVWIVHESDQPQRRGRFDLQAETVIAELARRDDGAAEPGRPEEPELRRLIAQTSVRFKARGINLTCQRIEYDPATGWLVASGTPGQPVEVTEGVSIGRFGEARYNLHTEQVQVRDFRGNLRR